MKSVSVDIYVPLYRKVEGARDGITLLNVSVIFTCFDVFKFPLSRITKPMSQARAAGRANALWRSMMWSDTPMKMEII